MKVQTHLSIYSSSVFGLIFLILSAFIYLSYGKYARDTVYDALKKTSEITAFFFLEEDELNKEEFAQVRRQFDRLVTNYNYQVYTETDQIAFGTDRLHVSHPLLERIRNEESLNFSEPGFFCHGIYYEDNQGNFVVITRESKEIITNQMRMLITLLIGSFLGGMIVIILLNRWLASVAYRPFRRAIREVNDLSTQNLDVQIELPTEKDELYDLIATFNTQLARIAEMVAIQKNFARYVSHEFKTPLAAMLGNLEVLTIKQRSPEEYERMTHKLIDEIYQLENILNTLSIISDLKKDNDVAARIRIDELLWEIIARVGKKYPSVPVDMNLEIDSNDEEKLWISLNRTQLAMALTNIIENAAKYSAGKPVLLRLDLIDDQLSLEIRDHGIGIPQDQLKSVCKPLYRAGNTGSIQGSGIGLSIALRILERLNLRFEIESHEGTGTRVTILF